MTLIKTWTMAINRDKITAIITDGRHLGKDMPSIPSGGCLIFLEGCILPLPLTHDDRRILEESVGALRPH